MKRVISASRRTDLVAFFPEWLSSVIRKERALVHAPSGHVFTADLSPGSVHTFVLWSKNFQNLRENRFGLKDALQKYDQLYFHLTITGLGGTSIEEGVPEPFEVIPQVESLVEIANHPRRVSVRFDPVVFWREGGEMRTNLDFFRELAPQVSALGIKDIRFSFAQWYRKAKRRAAGRGFLFEDPSEEEKKEKASFLSALAVERGLSLSACSQNFLAAVPGIRASSCIDGRLFQELHPAQAPVSLRKDKSQRKECGCTESVDIGSYTQQCPHRCVYCYASPRV